MLPNKKLLLFAIVLLAATLRFYKIETNPPGLFWDEASNGYNAYSILKTGRDEYGKFLPLIFKSYNDYRPPLYIYALVPTIKVFGLNEFAVRLPSALFGTVAVLCTYFIVNLLAKNNRIALLAAVFLAMSPWHIQFSRGGFEANLMSALMLLGFLIFLLSLKKPKLLIISSIFFALALNTYQGAKIWTPLFLIALIFWYRNELIKYRKLLVMPAAILIIAALPILLNFNDSFIRGKSVSIFNESKYPLNDFVNSYLSYFSPNFLFNRGDSIGRHSVTGMGQLYVFEIPLIVLGLLYLVSKKTRANKFLLTWFLIAPIPAAISTPNPHALRAITFIPMYSLLAALGASSFMQKASKTKVKIILTAALFLIGTYNFNTYLHLYYKHYPKEKGPDWQEGYKGALTYVAQNYQNYQKVVISDALLKPYIYTLFYLKYDPAKYQGQSEDKSKFAHFNFFQGSWDEQVEGKTLFVTSEYQGYPNHILKEVYSSNGDMVFRISDNQ